MTTTTIDPRQHIAATLANLRAARDRGDDTAEQVWEVMLNRLLERLDL